MIGVMEADMLDKNFDEINYSDIQELIDISVPESKRLEYKREIHLSKDMDKKEFLADISSFANADGGTLIYGLEEDKGIAKNIIGIASDSFDALIRQMESIIQTGLEPRITVKTKTINIPGESKNLILLRTEKSWYGPHRIIHNDKFYSRNSAGKYPLDTFELRNAFISSNSLIEKIDAFRDRRIMEIMNDNAPISLPPTGKIVLHFFPLGCFTTNTGEEFKRILNITNELGLLYCERGYNYKYNLNGFLMYSPQSPNYTQIFRNGTIEAVDGLMCASHPEMSYPANTIPAATLEESIFNFFISAMKCFVRSNNASPLFFSITLLHVKSYKLGANYTFDPLGKINSIERDIVKLPETIINDYTIKPETVLQPMFDMIWNACGYDRSQNFDGNGNFKCR
jgi:hypothetical protein